MCGRRGEGRSRTVRGDGGTLEAHFGQRTRCGVVVPGSQGFNFGRGVASDSHGPDESTSEAHRRCARNRGWEHHAEAGFEDHGTTNWKEGREEGESHSVQKWTQMGEKSLCSRLRMSSKMLTRAKVVAKTTKIVR